MRLASLALAASALSASASVLLAPSTLDKRRFVELVAARASEKITARQSSDIQSSYAPLKNQACLFPSGHDYVRPGTGLSPNETEYVAARLNNAKDPLRAFFSRAKVDVDGLDSLMSNSATTPRVAIAISGGGLRAMIHGSGGLSALDARNDSILGGLLQGSTYMAGLSGGSWAVTSFAASDMASPYYLDSNVWNLQESLVDPSGFTDAVKYYADIVSDVLTKRSDGFDTSITDLWGRALSYHLFDNDKYPDHAANASFGPSIRATSTFQSQQMPFPLVVALEREPNQEIVGQNASIFVFTPYEFGSFEPLGGYALGGQAGAFVPIDYVGTRWENGTAGQDGCVTGFTNLGFVPATSATLFNQFLLRIQSSGDVSSTVGSIIQDAVEKVLDGISSDDNDIAPYPNPFYQYSTDVNAIANQTAISMVDGGEALDNIPLWPLLSPLREVDFIMAFDSSADNEYSWPNGTAMIATWNRTVHNNIGYSMPNVPTSPNTWVNLGLNARPTFFGCNATDVTNHDASRTAPVIAYIPAYPWSAFANTSTFKLQYSKDESRAGLDNGMHSTTLNGTMSDWPACLACAVVKRSVERSGGAHSAQCQQCYDTWCWDGTTNETQPATWEPLLGSLPKFVADMTGQSQITPNTVFPEAASSGAEPVAISTRMMSWSTLATFSAAVALLSI